MNTKNNKNKCSIKESLRERAQILYGRTVYASSHLDNSIEHGYNDKSAINNAIDAIDMIINQFNDIEYIEYISKDLLLKWRDELEKAGRDDAYTLAIAMELNKIAEDIVKISNE